MWLYKTSPIYLKQNKTSPLDIRDLQLWQEELTAAIVGTQTTMGYCRYLKDSWILQTPKRPWGVIGTPKTTGYCRNPKDHGILQGTQRQSDIVGTQKTIRFFRYPKDHGILEVPNINQSIYINHMVELSGLCRSLLTELNLPCPLLLYPILSYFF